MCGENVHTQEPSKLEWTMSDYYVAYIFLHDIVHVIKWQNIGGCQAPMKLFWNTSMKENMKMLHVNKHEIDDSS